eukprot:670998-Rhodomonas_salina.2
MGLPAYATRGTGLAYGIRTSYARGTETAYGATRRGERPSNNGESLWRRQVGSATSIVCGVRYGHGVCCYAGLSVH